MTSQSVRILLARAARRTGTPTDWLLFAGKGSTNHCGCASHPTLHHNGLNRAVELTGAAFHACLAADKLGYTVSRGENTVGTDDTAHAAVDAELGIILKGIR